MSESNAYKYVVREAQAAGLLHGGGRPADHSGAAGVIV